MWTDNFGQVVLTEDDVCDLYLRNPDRNLRAAVTDKNIQFSSDLELTKIPNLTQWVDEHIPVEVWDSDAQSKWNMPGEYKDLDIAKWCLDQCTTDPQRQRVGEELMLYLDRNLFPLLQYLKYLVDAMRKYNIVWGVGRGSSVSSYVLYLIGVHKIDSMYYGLDVHEFLR